MGSRSVPSPSNTCTIIVTHHPKRTLVSNIGVMMQQCDSVMLVDNASEDEKAMLRDLAAVPGVDLIENSSNFGLARALNQGLWWAIERGFEWVLLLDQDTSPSDHIIASYADILRSVSDIDRVGVMGANYIDAHFGSPVGSVSSLRNWVETVVVITSGMLLSTKAAREIGPFRDDFFIDLVDHEYCLRARRKGFKVIMSTEPLIEHVIGTPTPHTVLERKLLTTNASPERRYYVARNFTVLWRLYRKTDSDWISAAVKSRAKELALVLMFEQDKPLKLVSAFRGILDGLRVRIRRRGHNTVRK